MNRYYAYVLLCDEGKCYIGSTGDLKQRIFSHNKKLSKWTSIYNNWRIVYRKKFDNYSDARKWEIYLKKQKGGNGFKKIIYSGVEQSGSSCGS